MLKNSWQQTNQARLKFWPTPGLKERISDSSWFSSEGDLNLCVRSTPRQEVGASGDVVTLRRLFWLDLVNLLDRGVTKHLWALQAKTSHPCYQSKQKILSTAFHSKFNRRRQAVKSSYCIHTESTELSIWHSRKSYWSENNHIVVLKWISLAGCSFPVLLALLSLDIKSINSNFWKEAQHPQTSTATLFTRFRTYPPERNLHSAVIP